MKKNFYYQSFVLGIMLSVMVFTACGSFEKDDRKEDNTTSNPDPGPGCGASDGQNIIIEQFEKMLAEQANRILVLSSEIDNVSYTIYQDPNDNKVYIKNVHTGKVKPIEVQSTKGEMNDTRNTIIEDANGVYVKYGDGENDSIYIPKFIQEANYIHLKVGGTEYKLPTNGGNTCNWTLTWEATAKHWSVSDGTNNVDIPIWIHDVEVSYDPNTKQFSLKSGDAMTIIPKGYADITFEETTKEATIKSGDGVTSIKLQPTQSVVSVVNGIVLITNSNPDGTVKDTYKLPQFGQYTALIEKVVGINTKLITLESQVDTWNPTAHNGKTIAEVVDSVGNELSALETKVGSMFETLMKNIAASITNIQVEEVMSNAIGSFNGVFTNLKTTKLVGYFGTTDEIAFPSHNPQFHKPSGEYAMSRIIGDIQLTVNPIGKDFSGVSVSLVNTLEQESSIKLSALEDSKIQLNTDFTRVDGSTGLYKTTASLETKDIEEPSLHIAVDKSAVRNAVKDVWNDLNEVYNQQRLGAIQGETLNKVANAIHNVVNDISTERLAVKTTYTYTAKDELTGSNITTTKSIVSPYDLGAVAVKPLGFESLPEQYRDSLRKSQKAKNAIKELNIRIAKKIIRTINENADIENIENQINDLQIKIKKVKQIPEDMKVIKQVVSNNTTAIVMEPIEKFAPITINNDVILDIPVEVEFEAVVSKEFQFDETTHKITVTQWDNISKTINVKDTINFVYTKDINIKQDIETNVPMWIEKVFAFDVSSFVGNVNESLYVVQSVDGLCNSAQKIINNIYKMEDRLLAGKYLNRIYKFIDKASAYTAKGIYKMFQPVLLINSDKGFGFAGIRGVPAEVSGTVEVIPTTYSNGLVAPVYKKYISVNGKNGKVLEEGQVALDITSDLKDGVNTIEYYAIDYYGNEFSEEYVVIKK